MCGIVGGFWRNGSFNEEYFNNALQALSHRGPDDKGSHIFQNRNGLSVFGHTRLSIIDLSHGGHQPKESSGGNYCIIFNGEIYNYRELRGQLQTLGYQFQTDSDTEVLLAAWQEWGISVLPKLVGMFAFAVYDKHNSKITLVRDAFGIKPLFYWDQRDAFVFGSEIPALLQLSTRNPEPNWQVAYDYLVWGRYDHTNDSFFSGIKHLDASHYLVIDLDTGKVGDPTPWWSPSIEKTCVLSFQDAAELLRGKFLDNIRLHLRSDVPIGAALSGGIDSSAVVCAIRKIDPSMLIRTFSYIASNSSVNEERWIDLINSHVGAIPHKIEIGPEELELDIDNLIRTQGEPFGSTSIYAQYRVFKKVKESGVTVTLDGQGADELFAGYHGFPSQMVLSLIEQKRFFDLLKFVRNWKSWPGRSGINVWTAIVTAYLPRKYFKIFKRSVNPIPQWCRENILNELGVETHLPYKEYSKFAKGRRLTEELQWRLRSAGLRSLLRHGDRNSMRFSIESRVPFLTTELAEFSFSLPEEFLLSLNGETKSIFREAMRQLVPNEVLDRRDKIGFETPERNWFLESRDTISEWLRKDFNVPFIDHKILLMNYNNMIQDQKRVSILQIWRWINFCKWLKAFH